MTRRVGALVIPLGAFSKGAWGRAPRFLPRSSLKKGEYLHKDRFMVHLFLLEVSYAEM